ncbi:hypothetical protein HK405_010467 [Cladochytrium tenue]|nr:hypothetical protein HK405_010467 [Cladochytrium tenue]
MTLPPQLHQQLSLDHSAFLSSFDMSSVKQELELDPTDPFSSAAGASPSTSHQAADFGELSRTLGTPGSLDLQPGLTQDQIALLSPLSVSSADTSTYGGGGADDYFSSRNNSSFLASSFTGRFPHAAAASPLGARSLQTRAAPGGLSASSLPAASGHMYAHGRRNSQPLRSSELAASAASPASAASVQPSRNRMRSGSKKIPLRPSTAASSMTVPHSPRNSLPMLAALPNVSGSAAEVFSGSLPGNPASAMRLRSLDDAVRRPDAQQQQQQQPQMYSMYVQADADNSGSSASPQAWPGGGGGALPDPAAGGAHPHAPFVGSLLAYSGDLGGFRQSPSSTAAASAGQLDGVSAASLADVAMRSPEVHSVSRNGAVSVASSSPTPSATARLGTARAGHASEEAIVEKRRRRRESHNAVERRRRDHINEKIQELNALLPEVPTEAQNKGSILRRSVAYVKMMQALATRQQERMRELEQVCQALLDRCGLTEQDLLLTVPLGTVFELPHVSGVTVPGAPGDDLDDPLARLAEEEGDDGLAEMDPQGAGPDRGGGSGEFEDDDDNGAEIDGDRDGGIRGRAEVFGQAAVHANGATPADLLQTEVHPG